MEAASCWSEPPFPLKGMLLNWGHDSLSPSVVGELVLKKGWTIGSGISFIEKVRLTSRSSLLLSPSSSSMLSLFESELGLSEIRNDCWNEHSLETLQSNCSNRNRLNSRLLRKYYTITIAWHYNTWCAGAFSLQLFVFNESYCSSAINICMLIWTSWY